MPEPGTNRGGYSTPITSYFKTAISREMNARGYRLFEDCPELLINFNTNAREQVDIRSTPSMSYGYGTTAIAVACMRPVRQAARMWKRCVTSRARPTSTSSTPPRSNSCGKAVAEGKITDEMMKNPQATIDGVITDMFAAYPVKAPGQ